MRLLGKISFQISCSRFSLGQKTRQQLDIGMVEGQVSPQTLTRRARKEFSLPAVAVLGGDAVWSVLVLLRAAGVEVAEIEAAPKQVNADLATRFCYGMASVRCGAMGDLRAVLQLVQAATGVWMPKNWVWVGADGSYIDGLRPRIDPYGFAVKADLVAYRAAHLAALAKLLAGVTTLVLPLDQMAGLVDAADGAVYPEMVAGAKLPRSCKLVPTVYTVEAMAADFAALHAALKRVNPGLVIRLVVAAPVAGLAGLMVQAQLRGLVAHWAASFADVIYDPVLDHLLGRMAGPATDARLGGAVQKLMAGGDLLDAVAVAPAQVALEDAEMGIPAPNALSSTPRDKRDRAQRRAERAKGKAKAKGGGAKGARVMCEEELLEAFS